MIDQLHFLNWTSSTDCRFPGVINIKIELPYVSACVS